MSRAKPVAAFRIDVPKGGEDAVIALLAEQGTLGAEHVPSVEPERSVLLAYFEPGAEVDARLRSGLADVEGARLTPHTVADVDWVARFRAGFRSFEAAGFRITPVWERDSRPKDARTLIVDPGRAFGTGTHETTRLCLAALERLASGPGLGDVLDLGTGSGLLGVAALRLGAASAVGIDNDEEALASARRHGRLNDAALRLVAGDCGRPFRPGRFDTVVANLMAPLLLARRDEISSLRRPGGRLVLSGLLVADLPAIRDAYRREGPLVETEDGEWAAVVVGATE